MSDIWYVWARFANLLIYHKYLVVEIIDTVVQLFLRNLRMFMKLGIVYRSIKP